MTFEYLCRVCIRYGWIRIGHMSELQLFSHISNTSLLKFLNGYLRFKYDFQLYIYWSYVNYLLKMSYFSKNLLNNITIKPWKFENISLLSLVDNILRERYVLWSRYRWYQHFQTSTTIPWQFEKFFFFQIISSLAILMIFYFIIYRFHLLVELSVCMGSKICICYKD